MKENWVEVGVVLRGVELWKLCFCERLWGKRFGNVEYFCKEMFVKLILC